MAQILPSNFTVHDTAVSYPEWECITHNSLPMEPSIWGWGFLTHTSGCVPPTSQLTSLPWKCVYASLMLLIIAHRTKLFGMSKKSLILEACGHYQPVTVNLFPMNQTYGNEFRYIASLNLILRRYKSKITPVKLTNYRHNDLQREFVPLLYVVFGAGLRGTRKTTCIRATGKLITCNLHLSVSVLLLWLQNLQLRCQMLWVYYLFLS